MLLANGSSKILESATTYGAMQRLGTFDVADRTMFEFRACLVCAFHEFEKSFMYMALVPLEMCF
jgi:hypothetical protein